LALCTSKHSTRTPLWDQTYHHTARHSTHSKRDPGEVDIKTGFQIHGAVHDVDGSAFICRIITSSQFPVTYLVQPAKPVPSKKMRLDGSVVCNLVTARSYLIGDL
jgi:hypothetical protein